jgi:hypothetical protein
MGLLRGGRGSTGEVDQAVEMDPRAVITMTPTEAQVAAGGQARFIFAVIERTGVAYSVESAVSTWCRLLLPAGDVGRGELVVDVPDDAGSGRYALRLVATASGQEVAAANVLLRIAGERAGGEPCLRVLPRPKFDLQPDGTVVVTLQVVNCGNVDATLVLRARHEDGWSFSVDDPELVIGVQEGPVTVKVTLKPPAGQGVDHGDQITVEVNVGTGWQPVRGRVPRRLWPWVAAAAAALVVAAGVAAAVLASQDESDDSVAVVTDETTEASPEASPEDTPEDTPEDPTPPSEPVDIVSFTVVEDLIDEVDDEPALCSITGRWDATGDSNGRLELYRGDEFVVTLDVGNDAEEIDVVEVGASFDYELKAFDSADTETDSETREIDDACTSDIP